MVTNIESERVHFPGGGGVAFYRAPGGQGAGLRTPHMLRHAEPTHPSNTIRPSSL